MPQKTITQVQTNEVSQDVAFDRDGKELVAGDWVMMPVRVTGIRRMLDPETGNETHQHLECSIVKPSGYNEHFRVLDSRLCRKIDPPAEGHT